MARRIANDDHTGWIRLIFNKVAGEAADDEQTRLPLVFGGLMALAFLMVASMLISLAPVHPGAPIVAVVQAIH